MNNDEIEISNAVKAMLKCSLNFDNYRKSILEDFWPNSVDESDEKVKFAHIMLAAILKEMNEACESILK